MWDIDQGETTAALNATSNAVVRQTHFVRQRRAEDAPAAVRAVVQAVAALSEQSGVRPGDGQCVVVGGRCESDGPDA